MREDKLSKTNLILYACGIIPVAWLALLIAPAFGDGLPGLIENLGTVFNDPFHIEWCEDSLKTVLIFILAYGWESGYTVYRTQLPAREEHGCAKWGVPGTVNKKYADKRVSQNKILTQNVAIGLDGRKHRRNLNVLCCGGSGSGKTRFYAKPNAMNANTSFVCLDPKGENLRDTGYLLESKGYTIKSSTLSIGAFSLLQPVCVPARRQRHSALVTNLFKNTTPKGSQSQDPFWDQAATMLLLALVFYLHYEAPEDEKTFLWYGDDTRR